LQQFSLKIIIDVKKQSRQAGNLALFIMCWQWHMFFESQYRR